VPVNTGKKAYLAPKGLRIGSVQQLTQNSGLPNSDIPDGPADTAECAGVDCPPVS
jgi:hypothetical protein